MEHAHQKDASPPVTIARIRKILFELGVFLAEEWHGVSGTSLYSVRLYDVRCPGIASAGKGGSRELALASAYGEFIERLQSGFFYFAGYQDIPDSATGYDVFSRCEVDLSSRDLVRDVGSNGCCAGNTPHEAIAQGLGEILERYVLQEMYLGGQVAPTVPLAAFASPIIRRDVTALAERGYIVSIKDCSLGGRFPVVGVVLVDRQGRVLNKFAADTNLTTAVYRCLTEVFQLKDGLGSSPGATAPGVETAMAGAPLAQFDNWLNTKRRGEGIPPAPLLLGPVVSDASTLEQAFVPDFRGNQHALHHLLALLRREQCRLLVKDNSWLGFPTFHVLVPELSFSRTSTMAARVNAVYGLIGELGDSPPADMLTALRDEVESIGPQNLSLFLCSRGLDVARQLDDAINPLVFKGHPVLAVVHLALGNLSACSEQLAIMHKLNQGARYDSFLLALQTHIALEYRGGRMSDPGRIMSCSLGGYEHVLTAMRRTASPFACLALLNDQEMKEHQYSCDSRYSHAMAAKLTRAFDRSTIEQCQLAQVFHSDEN